MSSQNGFYRFTGTDDYIVSPSLVDAVNCAIALERPLLIKGEPGTGKTLLAENVARALGMPMESWHIKSTSKASEGLYVYDTVQRLNDARFGDGDVSDIRRYIRYGPLGRSFSAEERTVLLIDAPWIRSLNFSGFYRQWQRLEASDSRFVSVMRSLPSLTVPFDQC